MKRVAKEAVTVAYTTRHLRAELLQKARVEAALAQASIEWVINEALALGLGLMKQRRQKV
jgi:hypothetical protein